jgi:hypothetical protein
MGAGRWSRWGRGSCEGYSLEFGFLLRFDIRPGPRSGGIRPNYWNASSRAGPLGVFPTFEAAAEACEAQARCVIDAAIAAGAAPGDMVLVLDHWNAFQALPKKLRAHARGARRR